MDSLVVANQELVFFEGAGLAGGPLLEVDEAQDQAGQEDADRGVFKAVELPVFRGGLVDDDSVDVSGDGAELLRSGPTGHGVEIVDGNHGRDDQTSESGQDEREGDSSHCRELLDLQGGQPLDIFGLASAHLVRSSWRKWVGGVGWVCDGAARPQNGLGTGCL